MAVISAISKVSQSNGHSYTANEFSRIFNQSINLYCKLYSPVKIRFNPKKIARKGFSTVSGTIPDGE